MRDLSLHLLDLMENSIAAGASKMWLVVSEQPTSNLLEITIEDNGRGLTVAPELAMDPFYTSKPGKRTGLGLSLFRSSVQQAGGDLKLLRSAHGGVCVHAQLQLNHIDRLPLGDLAATVSSIACTHPEIDIFCQLQVCDRAWQLDLAEVKRQLPEDERDALRIAEHVRGQLEHALQSVGVIS